MPQPLLPKVIAIDPVPMHIVYKLSRAIGLSSDNNLIDAAQSDIGMSSRRCMRALIAARTKTLTSTKIGGSSMKYERLVCRRGIARVEVTVTLCVSLMVADVRMFMARAPMPMSMKLRISSSDQSAAAVLLLRDV